MFIFSLSPLLLFSCSVDPKCILGDPGNLQRQLPIYLLWTGYFGFPQIPVLKSELQMGLEEEVGPLGDTEGGAPVVGLVAL